MAKINTWIGSSVYTLKYHLYNSSFDSSVGRAEDCRSVIAILRSLVRIRLEGYSFYGFECYFSASQLLECLVSINIFYHVFVLRYLRPVHTREAAPETRSRKTLPGNKYPNQYTRSTRRTKKISQFDWPTGDTSCYGKQISVHRRELANETDSRNRFAPGACSLISNQFDIPN